MSSYRSWKLLLLFPSTLSPSIWQVYQLYYGKHLCTYKQQLFFFKLSTKATSTLSSYKLSTKPKISSTTATLRSHSLTPWSNVKHLQHNPHQSVKAYTHFKHPWSLQDFLTKIITQIFFYNQELSKWLYNINADL